MFHHGSQWKQNCSIDYEKKLLQIFRKHHIQPAANKVMSVLIENHYHIQMSHSNFNLLNSKGPYALCLSGKGTRFFSGPWRAHLW